MSSSFLSYMINVKACYLNVATHRQTVLYRDGRKTCSFAKVFDKLHDKKVSYNYLVQPGTVIHSNGHWIATVPSYINELFVVVTPDQKLSFILDLGKKEIFSYDIIPAIKTFDFNLPHLHETVSEKACLTEDSFFNLIHKKITETKMTVDSQGTPCLYIDMPV